MRILLTNDDGIYADGIYALYRELVKVADVTVAAPDSERSSVGHGITLSHPIWFKKVRRKNAFFGYGISGTPADCVKFGTSIILRKRPDLIVSGINLGSNDGCSVFYSGTVAGAREGAMMGIPAVALSLNTFVNPDFTWTAKFSARLIRSVPRLRIPAGTLLNVNIPAIPEAKIKGVRFTRQGLIPIHGSFKRHQDPNLREYYWMTGTMPPVGQDLDVDTNALARGYVTVTPIQCDITNHSYLTSPQSAPKGRTGLLRALGPKAAKKSDKN